MTDQLLWPSPACRACFSGEGKGCDSSFLPFPAATAKEDIQTFPRLVKWRYWLLLTCFGVPVWSSCAAGGTARLQMHLLPAATSAQPSFSLKPGFRLCCVLVLPAASSPPVWDAPVFCDFAG